MCIIKNNGYQENGYKGDDAVHSVATGNRTRDWIMDVVIPMCEWLHIYWVLENPVTWWGQ